MLHVYDQTGAHVAMINQQARAADGYRSEEPWLLLYNSGRVDRFDSQANAKDDARKSWAGCTFKRAAH